LLPPGRGLDQPRIPQMLDRRTRAVQTGRGVNENGFRGLFEGLFHCAQFVGIELWLLVLLHRNGEHLEPSRLVEPEQSPFVLKHLLVLDELLLG